MSLWISKSTPEHRMRRAPLVFGYFMLTLLASVALAFGSRRLPPWALGVALLAFLGLVGLLFVRSQRELSKTFHRWRNTMPCYLSVQDAQLRIVETNDLFLKDFGDAVGEYCYEVYKRRSTPCTDCPVLKTLADGRNHTSEETVVTEDGRLAQVVVTSTPLYDARGRTVAVVEMSTNVTEIKTLRWELERSRQYFKSLFDIVPCYISVQDRDFNIVESNALFRKDFGEGRGKHCYQVYKRRSTVCPGCPVQMTFADGEVHSSEELVITRDGDRASTVVYTAPIVDGEGRITSVMEVSTNITEVKRQHELALMGLAIAGMAHRIKNILMGLEGGMFVMDTGFESDNDATVAEGWEMVERNVQKISRMVKDLLYCSRGREPKRQPNVRPEEIVREVHDLYRAHATAERIELQLELGGGSHAGTFDAEALHNLVVNLVTNAVDACRFDERRASKQHIITVRCDQDDDGNTVIEVADNGAGIPEEAQDKVFNGFFSTKGTGGTGLGLLVVQKVVQEHGGAISFSSRESEGTTFRVVLPPRAEERVSERLHAPAKTSGVPLPVPLSTPRGPEQVDS